MQKSTRKKPILLMPRNLLHQPVVERHAHTPVLLRPLSVPKAKKQRGQDGSGH